MALALAALCTVTRGAVAETTPGSAPPELGAASHAERDRWGFAVPDYVRLQTGGFLGMFTVGVGYSAFRDVLNVGVSYGYMPPDNGAPAVHLGTATLAIRPLRFALDHDHFWVYPLYVGSGLLVAKGKNLFVEQPAVYPSGYYAPTALHVLAFFGAEVAVRAPATAFFTRHSLFVELVTLDQYLDALTQNEDFRLYDAFSTALGYRASF